jgi:hypothetical protein
MRRLAPARGDVDKMRVNLIRRSQSHPTDRMNTKTLLVLATTSAAVAFFAGCASEPGPAAPQDSTKYTLENTENFELLGKSTQTAVAGTGLQPRLLPDGRLEVVASVKNREDRKVRIQVNCVFKDAAGFTTGDETPFETVELAPNATEAVRFTAANALAKKYTIRVREVH